MFAKDLIDKAELTEQAGAKLEGAGPGLEANGIESAINEVVYSTMKPDEEEMVSELMGKVGLGGNLRKEEEVRSVLRVAFDFQLGAVVAPGLEVVGVVPVAVPRFNNAKGLVLESEFAFQSDDDEDDTTAF